MKFLNRLQINYENAKKKNLNLFINLFFLTYYNSCLLI